MKTSLILVAFVVAVFTFTLMAVPVSADTSTDAIAHSCNCDFNIMDMQSSIPACCSMSDNSFPDCSLSEVPDDEAMLPGHSISNWDIQKDKFIKSMSTEIDTNPKQFSEQELPPLLTSYLCSEYHCRSSLDSEDPYLS